MRRTLLLAAMAVFVVRADELKHGSFRGQAVTYQVLDGFAVTEGDILLGTADELERSPTPNSKGREAVAIRDDSYRWTDRTVAYVIGDDVPSRQRILDAIQHWQDNTPIRLVERTAERNYVRFRRGSGCSSFVGMIGGEQSINLDESCQVGNIIHEIGHAVGLYHEQSRQDRDLYVQVLRDNLDKRQASNFRQELNNGLDVGSYDYGSVMQYSINGFSRNGLPTMATLPAGIPMGQRIGLSASDIDAVRRLYSDQIQQVTISVFPALLEFTVDGETYKGSRSFTWAWGSTHRISASTLQDGSPTRYRFARWSNGGSATQTITADPNVSSIMAYYTGEYRLPVAAVTAAGNVRVEPASPDGYYPLGAMVTLTALPDDGARFLRWSGAIYSTLHGRSQNPIRVPVDAGLSYEARFTRENVTTIASTPPGRRVVVDGTATTAPHSFEWQAGTTHTITVSPSRQVNGAGTSRYDFREWSDGGEAEHTVTATADSERVITAAFQTQHLLTTSISPNTGGRFVLSPASADSFYDEGTVVEVSPVATGMYRFSAWGEDGAESITMNDQMLATATFAVPGQLSSAGVVNAASFLGGAVAPGQIITIFGLEIGPERLTLGRVSGGHVESQVAGARVLFDGVSAPLIYAGKNQISAIVPYSVASRTSTRMQVELQGQTASSVTLPVAAAAPAFFTASAKGTGPGAFLNQDGSVNSPSNPAQRGSVVVLYATGEGQTTPAGEDGKIAISSLPRPVLPVRVFLGGREIRVDYAGGAPGVVAGGMQVNVRLPDDAPTGEIPIVLQVGDARSPNTVTVSIR